MTPSHCSGPRCQDLVTCEASRESSYHLRVSILTIGSLVFGITGVNANLNKYAAETFNFALFLVAMGVVYLSVMFLDGAYMVLCSKQYPYNVMAQAVLWPINQFPVNEGIKHEIKQLNAYPYAYVNSLTYHNVLGFYVFVTLVKVVLFFYTAAQAFILAERFQFGMAGLGATFSIEGWKKRLNLRDEINEVAYNTFAMAKTTGMDLGWEEDEFKLNRPIPRQHWYRGMNMQQPVAAARAYDGFSDDRRNVLL